MLLIRTVHHVRGRPLCDHGKIPWLMEFFRKFAVCFTPHQDHIMNRSGRIIGLLPHSSFVILLGTVPALHFPDAERIIHSLDRRQQRRM